MAAYVCVVDDDPCGEVPDLCWHAIEALAEGRGAEAHEEDPWIDDAEDFGADRDLGGEA